VLVACFEGDVEIVRAANADEARTRLADGEVDCLVVDARVADFGPADVEAVNERRPVALQLPVVLHGPAAAGTWSGPGGAFAMRRTHRHEELIDAAAFFLHRGHGAMSERERRAVQSLHDATPVLQGRRVLIVDDDMRNIFALATVLDEHGMTIVSADNGKAAIEIIASDTGIDIVLMDIMMPEMDGMETMREIRRLPHGRQLPIVAVTAKAMKGDREKCIEAGAWDYLSKPVDTNHLVATLRGWLSRR
jgi:CheY-like chemotaxis protein